MLFKSVLGLGKCVVEPLTKQFGWVQGSHILTELQKALFWFHVKTSKIGKSCSADKCFLSQNDLKKKKKEVIPFLESNFKECKSESKIARLDIDMVSPLLWCSS